jgi:extradiol dioxygenase
MTVQSLGYAAVTSPNAADWPDFAASVLGMQSTTGPDGAVRLRMDDRTHRITVYPGDTDRLHYLGWEVGGADDLAEFARGCERRGLAVTPGTDEEHADRGVLGLVWVTDPAGFRHEVYYGGDLLHRSVPIADGSRQPMNHFVTGEQGFGHAVLVVPDLVETDRFCREVLGLRVSDHITVPFDLRFYHCNPRHHSLALAHIPGLRGLHHLMVQLEDFDDVGVAYDVCQSRELPITMTLGKHTNDQMVSFYVRTPSGFDIEYGWGAREITTPWTVGRYDRPSVWGHRPADLPPGAVEPFTGAPAPAVQEARA